MERLRDCIICYTPPKAQRIYNDGYVHKLVLPDTKGVAIGSVDSIYSRDPFPFYFFVYGVSSRVQGNGYGSSLLRAFNNELITKKRLGVLFDTTHDQLVAGMYARHG